MTKRTKKGPAPTPPATSHGSEAGRGRRQTPKNEQFPGVPPSSDRSCRKNQNRPEPEGLKMASYSVLSVRWLGSKLFVRDTPEYQARFNHTDG